MTKLFHETLYFCNQIKSILFLYGTLLYVDSLSNNGVMIYLIPISQCNNLKKKLIFLC